jgi:hypothetical protein
VQSAIMRHSTFCIGGKTPRAAIRSKHMGWRRRPVRQRGVGSFMATRRIRYEIEPMTLGNARARVRAGERERNQPFRRSAPLRAHRSRRKISPPQATTSSGASIVSMTLLPSRWHSIAQMMHRAMTRIHQSLRTRSSSLSSGSICGPVKEPRRSGAVRDIGGDRSAASERYRT